MVKEMEKVLTFGRMVSKYIGDWKNDLKDGKGIDYYSNDEKYEGDFKNNK